MDFLAPLKIDPPQWSLVAKRPLVLVHPLFEGGHARLSSLARDVPFGDSLIPMNRVANMTDVPTVDDQILAVLKTLETHDRNMLVERDRQQIFVLK